MGVLYTLELQPKNRGRESRRRWDTWTFRSPDRQNVQVAQDVILGEEASSMPILVAQTAYLWSYCLYRNTPKVNIFS